MIILYNQQIFFSLSYTNSILDLHLSLEDCIIDDQFVIPLNSRFFHYFKKPITEIKATNFTLDTEVLGLIITKEKEIFVFMKDGEQLFKIFIPNTSSFCFDDLSKKSLDIFNNNLCNYKSNTFYLEDIVYDIYKKTVFQSRNANSYLTNINILASLNINKINKYVLNNIDINSFNLKDLTLFYKE